MADTQRRDWGFTVAKLGLTTAIVTLAGCGSCQDQYECDCAPIECHTRLADAYWPMVDACR